MSTATKLELVESNRRREERLNKELSFYPLSFHLLVDEQKFVTRVINYHHRGACLYIPDWKVGDKTEFQKASVNIFLGEKCIKSGLTARIVWQTLATDKLVGIEFQNSITEFIKRPERFSTHGSYTPQLEATDPLDPNRKVFLKVVNLSENGMLVSTSLTNRHFLPGMTLNQCRLSFPGQDVLEMTLSIENTRLADTPGTFELGVAIQGNKEKYLEQSRQYVAILAPRKRNLKGEDLQTPEIMPKKIKHGFNFKVISNEEDYNEVLKLRYAAYKQHGKLKKDAKWQDLGTKVEDEGLLIGAYLNGQLVGSMEVRFGDTHELRIVQQVGKEQLAGLNLKKCVELNKLVIHQKLQGTDAVMAILQKAHASAFTRGNYDVLCFATDKLARFYRKVGFQDLKIRVPHPAVPEITLNLLMLPIETWLKGRFINPYFWQQLYGGTHFFMESIGIVDPVHFNFFKRTQAYLTSIVFPHLRKLQKRKKRKVEETPKPQGKGSKSFIDPKWTTHHMVASIIRPYLVEADALIGATRVNSILDQMGFNRDYFENQTNWISVLFLDTFLEKYKSLGGDLAELSKRTGIRSLQRDQIGIKHYFLKTFVTPELAATKVSQVLSKFNTTRTYKTLELGNNRAKIAIGLKARHLLPKHKESCINWEYNLRTYISIMTGKEAIISKLACCYEGADACIYEIQWTPKKKSNALGYVFLAIASLLLGAIVSHLISPSTYEKGRIVVWTVFSVIGCFSWYSRELWIQKKRNTSFAEDFERFQKESDDRYLELQNAKNTLDSRYKEAKLLEETSKTIQCSTDLPSMLKATLDTVCQKFPFTRAFVMLRDEEKKWLRVAAVGGEIEIPQELWGYAVDVSVIRENPMVLSSVYHSGNPILINDVSTHLFQLNEKSARLIERLGTHGFIIVPVPSNQGNWGVLIADNHRQKNLLSKTELVLLQRVAQHLGIALDKQARLDEERNLRLRFQKFVPDHALELASGSARTLGSQTRDVACLFFDLRNFTKVSSTLPPQVCVEMLNRFYTMIEKEIRGTGAWIEKFLGDGMLITWGAIGDKKLDVNSAANAAIQIQNQMNIVNQIHLSAGLPSFRAGIGIHCGPAVVGNVGSSERMEFTSIGSTVNLASRLEGLSKELKKPIVVSKDLFDRLKPEIQRTFSLTKPVAVRGLADPVPVATWEFPHEREN